MTWSFSIFSMMLLHYIVADVRGARLASSMIAVEVSPSGALEICSRACLGLNAVGIVVSPLAMAYRRWAYEPANFLEWSYR